MEAKAIVTVPSYRGWIDIIPLNENSLDLLERGCCSMDVFIIRTEYTKVIQSREKGHYVYVLLFSKYFNDISQGS